jgi:hypothetical protein
VGPVTGGPAAASDDLASAAADSAASGEASDGNGLASGGLALSDGLTPAAEPPTEPDVAEPPADRRTFMITRTLMPLVGRYLPVMTLWDR